ncbi:MAG: DUF4292 domain-containing protein [Prevotella sp.]|nr:DUF4292 domain-containing protein [Prevotella sp.]
MKLTHLLKLTAVAIPFALASCHSQKNVVVDKNTAPIDTVKQNLFQRVNSNQVEAQFVSSKVKFSVEIGQQQITLTGNLRMKRDDVIRLQLMAFGFVEAARIEFTKDYVLIMDRINKQYLKAPYNYVDFLRNSGLNFYVLQALFWNELFLPGKQSLTAKDMTKFNSSSLGDGESIIDYEEGKMNYSWLTYEQSGRIKMANVTYRDNYQGNTQLNWDYKMFAPLGQKLFPSDMGITLTTPKKEVKLGIRLNYLGNESEWEPRTVVSNKYREVSVDEILRRFMAL